VIRLLSHPLAPDTPVYPGTPRPAFTPASRISAGDDANWMVLETNNHAGTHVDGPWHFNPEGRRITDLDPAELVFTRPALIDVPRSDDEVVSGEDLALHADALAGADLVLVRTGYGERWRAADPDRYAHHSPGFDRSAGRYLVDRCPALRAIAMDVISASCQAFVDEGLAFHRIMLGQRAGDRYVMLIEDARLDRDLAAADLGIVVMAPLLLLDQDGGPVTMLALPAGWPGPAV
jgi:kynurenine formamidase